MAGCLGARGGLPGLMQVRGRFEAWEQAGLRWRGGDAVPPKHGDIPDTACLWRPRARAASFTGGKTRIPQRDDLHTVLRGPDELPTSATRTVQSFLDTTCHPKRPVPFAAGQPLAALMRGGHPGAPPYTLLRRLPGAATRASGSLVRDFARAAGRTGLFSDHVRFQTIPERVFCLMRRGWRIAREKSPRWWTPSSTAGFSPTFFGARRPLMAAVVVIDGLDTAGGWEAGSDLFPIAPPPYLRVCTGAPADGGRPPTAAPGWRKLGWSSPAWRTAAFRSSTGRAWAGLAQLRRAGRPKPELFTGFIP